MLETVIWKSFSKDMEESMKGMQSEMSAKREKEESLAEKINDQERRLLLLNEEKERQVWPGPPHL